MKAERFVNHFSTFLFTCALLFATAASSAAAQSAEPAATTPDKESIPATYKLQAADEITLRSLVAKELADKAYRLDDAGDVEFPLIGRMHMADATISEAEALLVAKLKTYYVQPDLVVTVTAFHTEPISVIGSVTTPGVHQMKGATRLLDALSLAGGVRADAGPVAIVTRKADQGPIGYPDARNNSAGESVAQINLKSLLEGKDADSNIAILPHDIVSIPAAQVVYVVGNVKRSGGFPLGGRPNLSVLQALALAEGLDAKAAPGNARILRKDAGADKPIPVDLKRILSGKAEDITLFPNDILFVPNSASKAVTTRTMEVALQIATGLLIFH